ATSDADASGDFGNPLTLASDQPGPLRLALSEKDVYFSTSGKTIGAVAKAGGPVRPFAAGEATDLFVSPFAIVWIALVEGFEPLFTAALDGSGLASLGPTPTGSAYWRTATSDGAAYYAGYRVYSMWGVVRFDKSALAYTKLFESITNDIV